MCTTTLINGGERGNMDRIRMAHKLGRELQEYVSIKNARTVASYWVEKQQDRQLDYLDDNDKETIDLIASIVDLKSTDNPMGIADAIIVGKEKIQETLDFLIELGYSEDELKEHYSKNIDSFVKEKSEIEKTVEYFKSIELDNETIKEILLTANKIGLEETKKRVGLALNIFNAKNFVCFLIKERNLFYPHYYVDPVDCLETIAKELDVDTARTLLEQEYMFIYYWKNKDYRKDFTYGPQFQEALKTLEQYKQNK